MSCKETPSSPDEYSSQDLNDFRPISPPPFDFLQSEEIPSTPPGPDSYVQDTQTSDQEIQPSTNKNKRKITEVESSDSEQNPPPNTLTDSAAIRIESEALRKSKPKRRKVVYKCTTCFRYIAGKKEPLEFESCTTYRSHLRGQKHKKRLSQASELTHYCNICKLQLTKHDYERHIGGRKHRVQKEKLQKNIPKNFK